MKMAAIIGAPAAALLLVAFAMTSAPAVAQGTPQEKSACMGDAFRFCLSDIPNLGPIESCLKRNEAQLDPACRAEFQSNGRTRMRAGDFQ